MTDLIAKLRVALQLDSASFSTGAKRAASEVDALGTRAEKAGFAVGQAGKAMVAAGAAIAGSALVATLTDIVKQGLETASALGETAQQLGVSTKALQEYRYAATQVGVSQDEMDAGLAKLTRTMGEAASDAKGPSAAFDKLGIDIKAFVASGGDAGDLIPQIAQGLKGLGSDSERAATLVDLFGRSGQKLLPLMSDGAKGVNALREEARQLGIVLSDQQIQSADKTADKISQLHTVFNMRIAGVVADNANAIGVFAERLATLADKVLKLIPLLNTLESSRGWKLISAVTNPVAAASSLYDAVTAARNAGTVPARPSATSAIPAGKGAGWITSGKRLTTGIYTPGKGPLTNLGSTGSPFPGNLDRMAGAGGGGLNIVSALDAIGATGDQIAATVDRVTSLQQGLGSVVKSTNGGIVRSFKDMADGTVAALNQVAGAIKGGGFLNILSSVIGLGMQLGSIGLFGKTIAGRINNPIPARAMGGPVTAGRVHLVGERGPELFVPGSSGNIVPNHAMGGNTYNFSGNLLTPEWWAMINSGDMNAARAGAMGGAARVANSRKWALG